MAKNPTYPVIYDCEEAKEVAMKYVNFLKTKMKVKKVYLFGSYAKGTQHPDSDIDIAVISDEFKDDPVDDRTLLAKYTWDIETMIEPHPFLPKEFKKWNPFVREIIMTGIRLV